ncbi:MAG TPA: hypothetical protein DIT46_04900 [Gemmatimonadetes bacterium]|nr:hypothetical protein [Gemmatimonadota bacterium]
MKQYRTLFMCCVACVLFAECMGASSGGSDSRDPVLATLAEQVTLTQYLEFEAHSQSLNTRVSALCAEPTEARLVEARDAWWKARTPWKQSEVVQFGPVVEYPSRFGPKIDRWPVNASAVEDLVEGTSPLSQDDFDQMGVMTRGLPVIEYLLWAQGEDTVAELTANRRRCQVLAGVTADVMTNASRLVLVWRDDWIPEIVPPFSSMYGTYTSTGAVLNEWVNRMVFTVENIRLTKLGKPAGDQSNGKTLPGSLESRYSGRSLMDARDALDGVYVVWTGPTEAEQTGVVTLGSDAALVERIEALFADAKARLAQVPEPLEQAIEDEPEQVALAQESLRALQVALQQDLTAAIGVTPTFNDADGD